MDAVAALFSPPVTTYAVEAVARVRSYRNDVSHGSEARNSLTLDAAHEALSRFLAESSLPTDTEEPQPPPSAGGGTAAPVMD